MQLFEITKNDNAIFTCYILSGKLSCMDRDTAFVRFFGGALLLGWNGVCDILNNVRKQHNLSKNRLNSSTKITFS